MADRVFHLIRAGGRPLMAVPDGPRRVMASAIACYPPHSTKRRMIRSAVGLAAAAGALHWAGLATTHPLRCLPQGTLDDWLCRFAKHSGVRKCHLFLVWPGDPARGRVYTYVLGPEGGPPLAFGKIGLDPRNDALIDGERRVLEALGKEPIHGFRIPEIVDALELGGHACLLVKPVPADARATDWRVDSHDVSWTSEYSGPFRRIPPPVLATERWWQRLLLLENDQPEFVALARNTAEQGVDVCRVHGDLNKTNLLRHGGQLWIIDWEQSCENGPCLTDLVCATADRMWQNHRGEAQAMWAHFCDAFNCNDPLTRERIILALAFLLAADFSPAIALVRGLICRGFAPVMEH